MTSFSRYAIYYAPPPGALSDFGASWLGWNAQTAKPQAHPQLSGLPRPVSDLTKQPRKYGFHGTLKPPFRLAQGRSAQELNTQLDELATTLPPLRLPGLTLRRIGSFLALVPNAPSEDLAQLAARVVKDLDAFRAPPTEAELAKRRRARLSPAQEAHLKRWGYPYVLDQFRFHLTLTGPLKPEDDTDVENVLSQALKLLLPHPFEITELCLFAERPDGFFEILRRVKLTGPSQT